MRWMPGKVFDQVERVLEPSRGQPMGDLDLCALARSARQAFRDALLALGRDPDAYKLIVHVDRMSGASCEVSGPSGKTWTLDEFDAELSGQN
ncbi:MAG: hypothetical protein HY898_19255 [Deltaproteobacteria bacterium]|nr:hypothetical protein [Deltaproteobacteria bacterium]